MDAEEQNIREAIRDTLARYAIAVDAADYAMLGDCFTQDGVLVVEGGKALAGRATIVTTLSGAGWTSKHASRRDIFQRHSLSTCHILLDGGTAKAVTYYQVMTELGLDHSGRYLDRFERHGDAWLIRERSATLDWMTPASRFARLLAVAR